MTEKECKDCNITKPVDDFYVIRQRGTERIDCRCKACKAVLDRRPVNRVSRLQSKLRRLGIEWGLTLDEFTRLVSMPCDYCDGPLEASGRGLDRIDSNVGYIPSNVVPCCGSCNEMKGQTYTYMEMKLLGQCRKRIREDRERNGLPPVEAYCHRVGKRDRKNPKGSVWWVEGSKAYSTKRGARSYKAKQN